MDRVDRLRQQGLADNTLAAYKKAERYFFAWARLHGHRDPSYPVPSKLIEKFALDHLYGLKPEVERALIRSGVKAKKGKHTVSTIQAKIDGLSYFHKINNCDPNPCRTQVVRDCLSSGRRIESKSGIVKKKSKAITKQVLDRMIRTIPTESLIGKRDRAILIFGFYSGGRRRNEIATAEMRFLSPMMGGGYEYYLHRSKTDQDGKGKQKIIRAKYAKSIRQYLNAAGIVDGYIFRVIDNGRVTDRHISGHDINILIKKYIERIGEDPKKYSAHGIRRGFITTCGRMGVPLFDVMDLTDHRDIRTVVQYYEEGKITTNPATMI